MAFVTGNPEQDFFTQNPELQYISEFVALREDVGDETASKILWSIYMIEDPNSKIFRMPTEDKILEVQTNYYPDYDPEEYDDLPKVYAQYCMDKETWLYAIQIEKLDELTSGLKHLSIKNDKQFTKYMRIMDKLPKIWDGLEKVKAKMISKQNKTGLRGGARRSSRERR